MVRKYSGPLQKGKRSARVPKRTRGGLNKVEKKQTKVIAKATVNAMVSSKYFQSAVPATIQTPAPNSTASKLYNFAFSTSQANRINPVTNVMGPITYGRDTGGNPLPITTLNMSRIFEGPPAGTHVDEFEANTLVGQHAKPSFAMSEYVIERKPVETSTTETENRSVPYRCRVIRVVPKAYKVDNVDIDPRLDLFQSYTGQPTGVNEASYMTKNGFYFSRVNSRKYKVLMDKTYTLDAPTVVTTVGDTINNRTHSLKFKFKHDIGKKLYYSREQTGDIALQPTAGVKQEYIFFHFWAVGEGTPGAIDANEVRMEYRTVSTFKDA